MKVSFWQRLGPGILLAATSIGASHLVLSPRAGALFGFDLLWLVLAAHLAKYPAFEIGPRYAAATGQHLLAGYRLVPGPSNWALWLFLLSTVLQGIGVLAAVVNVSGAVLANWVPILGEDRYSIILTALVVILLLRGGFSWLDNLNKLMMAGLALATILAFIPSLPEPQAWLHLVKPSVPTGSVVLVAAILGWMPTGLDVSVWHSIWTIEKLKHLQHTDSSSAYSLSQRLKIALCDMRIGYSLSLVTGIMFVTIGAVHLTGAGLALDSGKFIQSLSLAYTHVWGRWMYHVFMLTAFFAMFSTSYTVIDGFSRSFAESLVCLWPDKLAEAAKQRAYQGFMIGSSILACVILSWVGNPVSLVTWVALISLFVAPILYGLNLYCAQTQIQDKHLALNSIVVMLGYVGVLFMLLAVVITVYTKIS